jgi:hypothetical protein
VKEASRRPSSILAALLVGSLASASSEGQTPTAALTTPAAPPPPSLSKAEREWIGSWSGTARLTNEGGTTACVYDSPAGTQAVTLDIVAEGGALGGKLLLALHAPAGSPCAPVEKAVDLRELSVSGSSLSFTGPGKHSWTLGRRGDELLGTVAWKGVGTDEGSALRLSGEVALKKVGGGRKGSAYGAMIGIVAANVVAGGALVLANKAGKGKDEGPPQVSCSPRRCFLVSLNEPCQCNTTLTTGGTCGTTTSGVGYAGACNVDGGLPCQAGLSCNSGFCEDRFGHCPF